MFTWICPQCGREVPPSYTECPACAERRQQAGQPPAPPQQQAPAPPPPQYQPPPPPMQAPPVYSQPYYAPPPPPPPQAPPPVYMQQQAPPPQQQQIYTLPEQKKGMPMWLVGVLTIAVLGGGLFGLYKFVGGSKPAPVKAALPADSKAHPYQKYLEVGSIRLIENAAKKPMVRFAVVNHSDADLSGLELNIVLTPTTGGEPVAVIDSKVGMVPAQGIKDMEVPLNTKLKIYELPDWQFVKATFEITAPPR